MTPGPADPPAAVPSRTARAGSSRAAVHAELRRRILRLELAPGSALSENELAAALGISRTPVREALILLADEGLVQVFPQVGSFVSRVDPARVRDAQFLREAVELAALQDLPAEPDPAVLAQLRANLDRQREDDLDREAFFELDEAFHAGLLRLTGHGGVWPAVAAAKGHLDRARRLGAGRLRSSAELAAQHEAVYAAAARGEADRARELLRTHLRAVLADVERIQTESPDLFTGGDGRVPVRRSVAVWR